MATAKKIVVKSKATAPRASASSSKLPTPPTRKPVAKAVKPAAKAAAALVKPAAAAVTSAPAKVLKTKKPKLVRDSFTIPKSEYVVLDELKTRAAALARPIKKSELLRAGIKALAAMDNAALLSALANVPAIKTGRPKQESVVKA